MAGKVTEDKEVLQPVCVDIEKENAVLLFGQAFCNCLQAFEPSYSDIVFLCIGSDRATGDSLGPLTGHKLTDKLNDKKIKLFGTLDNPVHASNLETVLDFIYQTHKAPLIVAIDACLGKTSRIGFLTIQKGSVAPGLGVKKNLPRVGDISITGVVNFSGMMELLILQNTRLHLIMKMADVISEGVILGFSLLKEQNETMQA